MTSRDNPDAEKPKRPRRKSVDSSEPTPEGMAEEPKSVRRKTATKAEETPRPPAEKKKRAPAAKKKPAAKQKAAAPGKGKVPPIGHIFRALWLARMIVRFAQAWGFVLLLLIIFGPALLRSIRPFRATAVAPLFTPEVQYWAPQIMRWSQEYGVDPNLIATLMQIESCGLPGAASSAGAQGLFQVMPMHFDPSENMTDPDTNARRGIGVIRDCLSWAENDVGLAMACYNGGPSLIYASPVNWPAESQRYYTWGGGIFNDAQRGASKSETLDTWLASGGLGLCQQAAVALGISTPPPRSVPTAAPTTPVRILPTLAIVEPGQAAPPTLVDQALPTFAMPTDTPAVKLFLTPTVVE